MSGRTDLPTPRTDRAIPQTRSGAVGLSLWALIALALLGVPRVILHDLDLIHEGTAPNLLLVVVPPLVWILVAVVARVRRPVLTLLVVGLFYGVLLALTHQLLWGAAYPGGGPSLGGNLADLDPTLQAIIMRSAAALSGVLTGVVVGALAGLVAEAVRAMVRAVSAGRR